MALATALAAFPAAAQQMKTVDGVVINIGIAKALMAEHVDAQHGVHKKERMAAARSTSPSAWPRNKAHDPFVDWASVFEGPDSVQR